MKTERDIKKEIYEKAAKQRTAEDVDFDYQAQLREAAQKKIISTNPTADDENTEAAAAALNALAVVVEADVSRQIAQNQTGNLAEATTSTRNIAKISPVASELSKRTRGKRNEQVDRAVSAGNRADTGIQTMRKSWSVGIKGKKISEARSRRAQLQTDMSMLPAPSGSTPTRSVIIQASLAGGGGD